MKKAMQDLSEKIRISKKLILSFQLGRLGNLCINHDRDNSNEGKEVMLEDDVGVLFKGGAGGWWCTSSNTQRWCCAALPPLRGCQPLLLGLHQLLLHLFTFLLYTTNEENAGFQIDVKSHQIFCR